MPYQKISPHPEPPPFIKVKGTFREIGRQYGEACRAQVQHSLENARMIIATTYEELELTWEGAQIQARKYLPFAQERYPKYVDEMMGYSEGANVPFDDVCVLTAMEAVTMDALHLTKCTSFAVNGERTADGHVLLAHNEDWLPEDEQDVVIVHAEPVNEPPFIAMTYGALLPNIGFNAYGIAQACDSVYPNDSRIGIPRVVVSRAVLGAKRPADAIRQMLIPQRGAGYNHMLAHESGELYNVEVSARNFSFLYAENGALVHTNHFLAPHMQAIEADSDELIATRVRYHRARRLLNLTELHTLKTIQAIQKDHINHPDSICNHADTEDNPLDREKTINAMVMDLTARALHIAWGNPCENNYHTYYLEC